MNKNINISVDATPAIQPVAKFLGTILGTITDVWKIFTLPINYLARIEDFFFDQKYEISCQEIQKRVQEIPEQERMEPDPAIIVPAIEYAIYHNDQEELRRMFVNLISSAFDRRNESKNRTAFVEILKQLSPEDAVLLRELRSESTPIVDYTITVESEKIVTQSGHYTVARNVLEQYSSEQSPEEWRSSLDNLLRLGLYVLSNEILVEEHIYDWALRSDLRFALEKQYHQPIQVHGKTLHQTQLGKDFRRICLTDRMYVFHPADHPHI